MLQRSWSQCHGLENIIYVLLLVLFSFVFQHLQIKALEKLPSTTVHSCDQGITFERIDEWLSQFKKANDRRHVILFLNSESREETDQTILSLLNLFIPTGCAAVRALELLYWWQRPFTKRQIVSPTWL